MTADELLAAVAGAAGDRALLWRGDQGTGHDIDLLVHEDVAGPLFAVLSAAGLTPEPAGGMRTVWSDASDRLPPIDVLAAAGWAPYYPTLDSVTSRARPGRGGLLVAAAEDRLLMLAGEAVAGRPVEKIARKASVLVGRRGVRSRVAAVGAAQGAAELAALISQPSQLERLARDGRLPYGEAVRLAVRSRMARAALRARVAERARAVLRGEARPPRPGDVLCDLRGRTPRAGTTGRPRGPRRAGRILALSGMDGSGKSTLADTVIEHLEGAGQPVELAWVRVASEGQVLERVATPVKRLLRREGSTADPVAAADRLEREAVQGQPTEEGGRTGAVAWAWVLVVAAFTARGLRRANRRRCAGATVMCDRWLTDALVDLELRYGRHRAAEALLRRLAPRADLALLLTVDAETAAGRKPGDQSPAVLARMEDLYAEKGARTNVTILDARRPPDAVAQEAIALVDGLR